jgi:predicted DCC family thiol-disulfide oxidoreductase YuxK
MSQPILLYDGVCGLCNRFVQFILRRDGGEFRFAPLQSPFAAPILARHGANPANLDTVYVVLHYNENDEALLDRSDAVVFVLRQIGGGWELVGRVLAVTPRRLRDWGYRIVARHRYRIFGRFDACPAPTPETRARFLDQ